MSRCTRLSGRKFDVSHGGAIGPIHGAYFEFSTVCSIMTWMQRLDLDWLASAVFFKIISDNWLSPYLITVVSAVILALSSPGVVFVVLSGPPSRPPRHCGDFARGCLSHARGLRILRRSRHAALSQHQLPKTTTLFPKETTSICQARPDPLGSGDGTRGGETHATSVPI